MQDWAALMQGTEERPEKPSPRGEQMWSGREEGWGGRSRSRSQMWWP